MSVPILIKQVHLAEVVVVVGVVVVAEVVTDRAKAEVNKRMSLSV